MEKSYSVKLIARNEGIEYHDESGVYRFNVSLTEKKWVVYLPCSKGDFYQSYELNEAEYNKIIPHIVEYLENRKYFGIFGSTYPVIIEREGATSPQLEQSRQRASKYWADQQEK